MLIPQAWLGGLCALATACLWAMSATAWGFAGRRVDSLCVAAARLLLAAVMIAGAHWAIFGVPWPVDLAADSLVLLAASGALAMGLGDMCGFRSIFLIGPRLSTVIGSLTPIATTAIAWIAAKEALSLRAVSGIVVIVAGVAWVVSEPRGKAAWLPGRGNFRRGVLLALGSNVCCAVGYIFSRSALNGGPRWLTSGADLPPVGAVPATLVRLTAGLVLTWSILPFFRKFRPTLAAFADRKAMTFLLAGTVVGPLLGVWTSMIALHNVPSGIASALISSSPIFMIPISAIAFGEKHSFRSLIGTVLAVAGVFLLLL